MLKATNSARIRTTKCLEVIEAFNVEVTRSLQIITRGARWPSHPECTDDLVCCLRKICSGIRNWLALQRPIVHVATLGFPSMEDHSSSEETHVWPFLDPRICDKGRGRPSGPWRSPCVDVFASPCTPPLFLSFGEDGRPAIAWSLSPTLPGSPRYGWDSPSLSRRAERSRSSSTECVCGRRGIGGRVEDVRT